MNEIELAKLTDDLTPKSTMLMSTSVTGREAEIVNAELKRRGSWARLIPCKTITLSGRSST